MPTAEERRKDPAYIKDQAAQKAQAIASAEARVAKAQTELQAAEKGLAQAKKENS